MKNKILMVVGAVVIAGLGFGGGLAYAKSKTPTMRGAYAGGPAGAAGARTSRAGGSGVVSGSILSTDANSVTVKMANGGSKIVYFSANTQVLKSVAGATTDLTAGANVVAIGTAGTDGTVTAQSIQIRPAGMPMMGGFGGGRGQGQGGQQPSTQP